MEVVCGLSKLTKMTRKNRHPMPFIDEFLNEVVGHTQNNFCDGYNSFHQGKVRSEVILKTTFLHGWGNFVYKRMSFSLCNAIGMVQRLKNYIFQSYIGSFIHVYLDAFCVYSLNLEVGSLEQVAFGFQNLARRKRESKSNKMQFPFLRRKHGSMFLDGPKVIDADKVQRVFEMHSPCNVHEVRMVQGHVGASQRSLLK